MLPMLLFQKYEIKNRLFQALNVLHMLLKTFSPAKPYVLTKKRVHIGIISKDHLRPFQCHFHKSHSLHCSF